MNYFSWGKNWQFSLAVTLLLISGITALRAQVPAGPNRPPAVPEGYVITPMGYFHPSCVQELAEGDIVREDEKAIEHKDGSFESIPDCAFPHYTPAGEKVPLDGEGTEDGAGNEPPAIVHDYIELATMKKDLFYYGELRANWLVPPAPTSHDGQVIYLFPGLEDYRSNHTTILQPVLGWNADFSDGWGIASWNCCPSGITVESAPVRVKAGHEILGTIKDTCGAGTLSCSTWNVTTEDVTTGKSTKLSNTPSEGQTFNWAFAGALEVYNIAKCTDYPRKGSIAFSSLALYDYNFDLISNPGWSIVSWASGLAPQCNYGGQVAATQVTLDY